MTSSNTPDAVAVPSDPAEALEALKELLVLCRARPDDDYLISAMERARNVILSAVPQSPPVMPDNSVREALRKAVIARLGTVVSLSFPDGDQAHDAWRVLVASRSATPSPDVAALVERTAREIGVRYGMGAKTAVDAVALILFDAFAKAEPNSVMVQHPTSYWATFADMARAALPALSSTTAPAMDRGWQPIETAPRDGTQVIAYQEGDIYTARWLTDEPDEGPPTTGWWDTVNASFEAPTHWIPQPAAPVSVPEDRA